MADPLWLFRIPVQGGGLPVNDPAGQGTDGDFELVEIDYHPVHFATIAYYQAAKQISESILAEMAMEVHFSMGKPTRLVGSEADYADLASAYQVALVSALDQALRDSGISPKRKRRKICERFMHAHGVLHDQCWLRSGGKKVYPLLGFSEIFQNVGMSPKHLGKVILDKEKFFSFDEYVWSVLSCQFEPSEENPQVEVGLVGEEPD